MRTSGRRKLFGTGQVRPDKARSRGHGVIRSPPVTVKVAARDDQDLLARIAELEAALVREQRISQALRDVGLALGTTLDLDQLLELILNKITDLLEADRATLYLLDEANGELVSRIAVGDAVRSIRLKVGQGLAGVVARTGRTIRVKDAYRDKRFDREWDELTGYRTRSILAAPMKNHLGRTIGVVQVLNKRAESEFTANDEELLTALATQAAVSIDNSRLFLSVIQKNMQLLDTKEQLEHRVRDLNLLFELESAMARASSQNELLRVVLAAATRACEAQAGAVLVAEEGSGDLVLNYLEPKKAGEIRQVKLKAGEGFTGWAMQNDEPCLVDDASRDVRLSERAAAELGLRIATAVAVPLEGEDGRPMGAMGLYNKGDAGTFTREDVELLRLVSANVSTAIQLFRSRVAREREERLSTIGRLLSSVIHDLKTPMTIISGYVQIMATARDDGQRKEYAELVLKQFDIIAAMQREVLEFARGERNVLVRRVYLGKFFGDFMEQLKHEIDGKRVKLVLELEEKGTARFDEGKMTRVLHNLARNAIEAMGAEGGTLTIGVRRAPKSSPSGAPELLISVGDTGPGIPKEIEGRLFESFVTAGKKGGTGLGLAIVKKIVEEHGGSVTVQSSPRGTTFVLHLPQRNSKP
jgi:signal transduction histidine kinase